MAWYDDPARTTFVATYANDKQFRWDLEAASRRGWSVQPGGEREEELVIGAPPTTSIRVTFIREEGWLASREREIADSLVRDASHAADAKEARYLKAADELARAEEQFSSRLEFAGVAPGLSREQAERDLLAALKDVIARRRVALRTRDEAIAEMESAVAVGAAEFARSLAVLKHARPAEAARLEAEVALLPAQDAVTRAAREWRDAAERRNAAEEQLNKRTAEFESKDEAFRERLRGRDGLLDPLGPANRSRAS